MPARLSKRQQRELQELTHTDEIVQARESSDDEDVRFASTPGQSAFAAVSRDILMCSLNELRVSKASGWGRGQRENGRGVCS